MNLVKNVVLFFLFLFVSATAFCWETDQYTLPPQKLADIGSDISKLVHSEIKKHVGRANVALDTFPELIIQKTKRYQVVKKIVMKRISRKDRRRSAQNLKETRRIDINKEERLKLAREIRILKNDLLKYSSEAKFIESFSLDFSENIAAGEWEDGFWGDPAAFISHADGEINGLPISFCPTRLKSIYSFSGFHRVASSSYLIFSSTINLFGSYFGVDKLGHIFSQGHQYYEKYVNAITNGHLEIEADRVAVDFGIGTENSYFGLLSSGVYSNGDLAANFSGLYFYKNLFSPIEINGTVYREILTKKNGRYFINDYEENSSEILLQRFVSDHFNEAYNPSFYEWAQRIIIKQAIKHRCPSWKIKYPYLTAEQDLQRVDDLSIWNGMDYGHHAEDLLKIGEICY